MQEGVLILEKLGTEEDVKYAVKFSNKSARRLFVHDQTQAKIEQDSVKARQINPKDLQKAKFIPHRLIELEQNETSNQELGSKAASSIQKILEN